MSVLQPWMAVGVVWVSPTLRPHSPFLGQRRVSPRGHLSPANTSPSPQCGEGTPQVTGFFEVLVAGKLVHSKKVCLSVHSAPFGASGVLGLGLASWSQLIPRLFLPSPGRRWLRGHGEQVSEAGGCHQSRFGSGLMGPEGRGEGDPAPRRQLTTPVPNVLQTRALVSSPIPEQVAVSMLFSGPYNCFSALSEPAFQFSSLYVLDETQTQPVLELGPGY